VFGKHKIRFSEDDDIEASTIRHTYLTGEGVDDLEQYIALGTKDTFQIIIMKAEASEAGQKSSRSNTGLAVPSYQVCAIIDQAHQDDIT